MELSWVRPSVNGERRGNPVSVYRRLFLLRALRLRFIQDGDVRVGVGVFPEGEEVLAGGERPHAPLSRCPRGSRSPRTAWSVPGLSQDGLQRLRIGS